MGRRAIWILVGFLHILKGSGSLAFGGSSDPSKFEGKIWKYDLYSWSDQGITRRATLPNTSDLVLEPYPRLNIWG
jgi:hypothetical protein